MRSYRTTGSMAVAFAVIACACGSSSQQPAAPDAAIEVEAGPTNKATSIVFDPDATFTLAPGAKATLEVVVQPAGAHSVRFSLVGDSLDGSLDADLVQTSDDGRASVQLTAPQSATAFEVRAVANEGPTAEAVVSVSGTGFATLTVVPSYAGTRSTPQWTATGAALMACSDKSGIPPQDGPLTITAPAGSALVLDGLPAGPKLAITARSGHAVGGCADLARLNAGEQRSIVVKVEDRPIDLGSTNIELQVVLAPDGAALKPWLDASVGEFVEAFAPKGNEAAALLDAMQALAQDPSGLSLARTTGKWDDVLVGYLEALGKPLGDRIRTWAATGSLPLMGGVGLIGHLQSTQAAASHPDLTIESFGELDASKLGPSYDYTASLAADPGDTVHIGGSMYLLPTQFVAAAVDAACATAGASDGASALLKVLSCSKVATTLAATGTAPSTCTTACLQKLCTSGLENMWQTARDTSANSFEAASLSFNVSAVAQVDEDATIVSLDGTWTGEFASGQDSVSVKGTATGTTPPAP